LAWLDSFAQLKLSKSWKSLLKVKTLGFLWHVKF
jgi:hypothetical protein